MILANRVGSLSRFKSYYREIYIGEFHSLKEKHDNAMENLKIIHHPHENSMTLCVFSREVRCKKSIASLLAITERSKEKQCTHTPLYSRFLHVSRQTRIFLFTYLHNKSLGI